MTYSFLTKVLLVATVGALGAGCSAIRVVKLTQEGGEIALLGDRDDAMEKAEREMARQCGGPGSFEVVEQGEVVVGQVTQTQGSTSTQKGKHGSSTGYSSGTATTTDQTEWRVLFQCRTAEADTAEVHALSIPFAG
jgi:hypothetical protein